MKYLILRGVFITSIVLELCSIVNAQNAYLDMRVRFTQIANDTLKIDSAFSLTRKMEESAIQLYGLYSSEYYASLNSMAWCYSQKKEKVDSAEKLWLKIFSELEDKKDTAYLVNKWNVSYNLLFRIYLFYKKQPDSARYFAGCFIAAAKNKAGKDKIAYLNDLCMVAEKFGQTFGDSASDEYYRKALELREQIWGSKNRDLVLGIDSLLKAVKPKSLLYQRLSLYRYNGKDYDCKTLDSLAKKAMEEKDYWGSLQYRFACLGRVILQYPNNDSAYVDKLENVGNEYELWGGSFYSFARYCYEKVLDIVEKSEGKNSIQYAGDLHSLSRIFSDQAKYAEAIKLNRNAIAIYESKNVVNDKYCRYMRDLGLYYEKLMVLDYRSIWRDSAIQLHKKALEITGTLHDTTSKEYTNAKLLLGWVYAATADLNNALKLFLEIWQQYEKNYDKYSLEERRSLASRIADTYQHLDDNAKQNIWLERVMHFHYLLNDTTAPSYSNDLIAYTETVLDTAKRKKLIDFHENLVLRKQGANSQPYAVVYEQWARYHEMLSQYDKAVYYFNKANSLLNDVITDYSPGVQEDIKREIQSNYDDLSFAYLNLKDYPRLYESCKKSLSMLHQRGLDSVARGAKVYSYLGRYYLGYTHKTDSAAYCFKKALSNIENTMTKNSIGYAESEVDLGIFYRCIGKLSAAERILGEACEAMKTEMVTNMAGYSENEKAKYNERLTQNLQKYYSLHQDIYKANDSVSTRCYNLVIQSKGLLLSTTEILDNEIEKSGDSISKHMYNEIRALRNTLVRAYKSGNNTAAGKKYTDSLQDAATSLERTLSDRSSAFLDFRQQDNVKFEDVKKSLASGDAAIEFVAFPYYKNFGFTDTVKYGAFIVRPGYERPVYVPIGSEAEFRGLVSGQGMAGRGLYINPQSKYHAVNSQKALYRKIWAPLGQYLRGVTHIYIATDGLLNKVAFAALQDSGHKFLADKYAFHFVLNTKDIIALKKDSQNVVAHQVALFGGADFDAHEGNGWRAGGQTSSRPQVIRYQKQFGYLSGTLTEVRSISGELRLAHWAVDTFTGLNASEKNFKYLTGDHAPAILHIATHGFYAAYAGRASGYGSTGSSAYSQFTDPLMRSGLAFSGANHTLEGNGPAEGDDDGVLTAYEIANMDLSKTKLVVLSACETGAGEIVNGEGVYGLQRALRMAGVKNMLVSLWPVSDPETAEMMIGFYGALAKGCNPVSALKQAQAKMRINHSDNPASWSGFILIE